MSEKQIKKFDSILWEEIFFPKQLYIISNEENKFCRVGISKNTVNNRLPKYQSESPFNLKISFLSNGPDEIIKLIEKNIHENLKDYRIQKSSFRSSKQGSWYNIDTFKCVRIVKEVFHLNKLSHSFFYNTRWPYHNGSLGITYFMIDPKKATTNFTNRYSNTSCSAIIVSVPNLPKYILNKKLESVDDETPIFDASSYTDKTLNFIKKNGFKHFIFSSIKSANEILPILLNHSEVVNGENILEIVDGECFDKYSDAFFSVQNKIINYQKKVYIL